MINMKQIFSGKFCTTLLQKTAKWTQDTSLVQVIRAVVDHIDHPNVDYSASFGLDLKSYVFFLEDLFI